MSRAAFRESVDLPRPAAAIAMVIGAGVTGAEYAFAFACLGVTHEVK